MKKSCVWIPRSDSDRRELHVTVFDAGVDHAALFVHGFIGQGVENHRMFRRLAETLYSRGISSCLFDQLGCGLSDGAYDEVSVGALEADIEAAYRYCARQFARVSVVSQSLGSTLVIRLLAAGRIAPASCVAINPVCQMEAWLPHRFGWSFEDGSERWLAMPKGIWVSKAFVKELCERDLLPSVPQGAARTLTIVTSGADEVGADLCGRAVAASTGCKWLVVPDANHSFVGQPDQEKHLAQLVSEVVSTS